MLPRQIRQELLNRLAAYPAVALIGPRQCGKTTLGRSLGGVYFDLEQGSGVRTPATGPGVGGSGGREGFGDPGRSPVLAGCVPSPPRCDRLGAQTQRTVSASRVGFSLADGAGLRVAGRAPVADPTDAVPLDRAETQASRKRLWLRGGPGAATSKPITSGRAIDTSWTSCWISEGNYGPSRSCSRPRPVLGTWADWIRPPT